MGEMLVEIMRPQPGIPLYEAGEFSGPYPSGAPAIFIDTAARLGHPTGIIGGVGDDDFGRCLLDRLQADGVDCSHVLRAQRGSTGVAFVTYFEDGSRQFIFHIDGTPAVMAESTSAEEINNPAFFHIMGCSLMVNKAFRMNILGTMESFHAQGAKISFDPNIRTELLGERKIEDLVSPVMERCSVLLPGVAELALLSGVSGIENGVQQVFDTWPVEIIVVKQGKQGSSIYTRTSEVQVPAFQVDEVDPTGAGDCFDAAFLCGLLENLPLETCGMMASAAGALNAAAFGPMEGSISPQTIEAVMRKGYV
jgi:sugar/nucleoside kinase (ribokinase family)